MKTVKTLAKAWLISRIAKELLGVIAFVTMLVLAGYGFWAIASEICWTFGLW